MLGLDGRRLLSRAKGRAAIERRFRRALIAVDRRRARATSRRDLSWCAEAIDALTALLAGGSTTTTTDRGGGADASVEAGDRQTDQPSSARSHSCRTFRGRTA